jgi:hypothetical protein
MTREAHELRGDPGVQSFFTYLVPIACGAVAVVLLLGLFNMMRGGSASRSQQLMRWRVGLQFAAIVIIMITVWLMGRGPTVG